MSPLPKIINRWLNAAVRLALLEIICSAAMAEVASEKTPLDLVDPRIGSAASRWFFFTPGAMPFGMAKPGPCTDAHLGDQSGWEAVGYDGLQTSIEGFACFHEFQVGGVVLMPTIRNLVTVPGLLENPDSGYRSPFDKNDEVAEPGYYSVILKKYNIRTELTATPRVSFFRYTYPEATNAHLLFDIGNKQGESGAVVDAFVKWNGHGEVEGSVITHPEFARIYQPGAYIKMYFVAQLDKTPVSYGTFRGREIHPNEDAIQGLGAGLYLNFATSADEAIVVKLGQSYTSIANARLSLEKEAANLSFDQALQNNQDDWRKMLGRIQVEGGKESDRVKFYTGLYHVLLGRGLASDINGDYPKNDGGVGQIPLNADGTPKYNFFNTDSMWGAFWDLTQIWALAYPEYYSQFVQGQLNMYRDCGWLPDGIATGKFVSGVGTDYMGLIISSAYEYGIRDYDIQEAWDAVLKNETGWQNRPLGVGKADVRAFLEHGYVPQISASSQIDAATEEGSQYSASHTLEYSFSAYAAAQFAKALGRTADYDRLMDLSRGWDRLFNSKTGFIQPKDVTGKFIDGFNPKQPWGGFQEGNAYQYLYYVPHDPAGLIRIIGLNEFNKRLDFAFKQSEQESFDGGQTADAFSGLESMFNQGNEPCMEMPWLFNYSGKPWLTQYWVRRVCDIFYGTEAFHGYGYGQDEDQGQMGGWFVLAGIGLFDVQGGTSLHPTMQLGTPLFNKVRIQLDRKYYPGDMFEIDVNGDPAKNIYIESAALNGIALDRCWINWTNIIVGGTLNVIAGNQPNTSWGVENPPPSASSPQR
jgi:predicted alpha-1,2-mannosidase